jgi:regulator of sirC expression with transglutaminase-like and TPR domain
VLFEEEGFTGNTDDYYNVANSYLPVVLQTRRGLPITLSLIYKAVAERLGLRVWGIGLPGHFIVGFVEVLGSEMEWSDDLLQPITNRHWLTRILQNLLHAFGNAGRFADVAAVLELEMLLWPKRDQLQRDLALVLARCGMSQPASIWLDRYLKNNPDDPQRSELAQLLDVLK